MDFFPLQPSCISPALWKQEQSRAAKQRNALARQKHSEVLAEGRGDSSLVPHRQTLDFDTSGLADDKYAIAESILEAERKSCPGWMQTKHVEFEREHGQLMQLAGKPSRMQRTRHMENFVNAPLTFVRGMLSGLMTTRHGSINAEKFCVSAGTLGKPKVSSRITRWSLSFLLRSKAFMI